MIRELYKKPKIFISYRRTDSSGHAGRMFDDLVDTFGSDCVTLDIDRIKGGENYSNVIEQEIRSADVLLAVIGKHWLVASENGLRRLDDPEDLVRKEIQMAFAAGVRIIPVLVQGAKMPEVNELPSALGNLSSVNGIEVSDSRWKYDMDRLIATIRKTTVRERKKKNILLIAIPIFAVVALGFYIYKSGFFSPVGKVADMGNEHYEQPDPGLLKIILTDISAIDLAPRPETKNLMISFKVISRSKDKYVPLKDKGDLLLFDSSGRESRFPFNVNFDSDGIRPQLATRLVFDGLIPRAVYDNIMRRGNYRAKCIMYYDSDVMPSAQEYSSEVFSLSNQTVTDQSNPTGEDRSSEIRVETLPLNKSSDKVRAEAPPHNTPLKDGCKFDNQKILDVLKEHLDDRIPYYGNSEDGNVKPQMLAYLRGYKISRNPDLLKNLSAMEKLIEEKSNAGKPAEYFNADNDFRAGLDEFLLRVKSYIITCNWNP